MRIGIIAALPGELKPLVRGWAKVRVAGSSGIRMWQTEVGGHDVAAVCAGMGAAAALRAFTAAEHAGALDLVISAGWAGALVEHLRPGGVYVASEVVDTRTGERTSLVAARRDAILVTTPVVAGAAEKERLAHTYGAEMVDMEAATVARLAQMRAIPMLAIKAISDGLNARLPDLNPFVSERGQMNLPAFVIYALAHPSYWAALLAMGAASTRGAEGLARAITAFLENADAKRSPVAESVLSEESDEPT